jgi:hypothetical protein
MLSRTQHASVAARAASMRRLRRRTVSNHRLFCTTNGCASFMELDLAAGVASCNVCGATRRLD